jgi:hypothetical protein
MSNREFLVMPQPDRKPVKSGADLCLRDGIRDTASAHLLAQHARADGKTFGHGLNSLFSMFGHVAQACKLVKSPVGQIDRKMVTGQ